MINKILLQLNLIYLNLILNQKQLQVKILKINLK